MYRLFGSLLVLLLFLPVGKVESRSIAGHHYSRAMASWGAVLALSGFQYSAVEKSMTFARTDGEMFLSNGSAWGICRQTGATGELSVCHGSLELETFSVGDSDTAEFKIPLRITAGETAIFDMK